MGLRNAEEDKRERRRKLGLPEEPTEEEKAAAEAGKQQQQQQQQPQQQQQQRSANAPPALRVAMSEQLRAALVAMKKAYPGQDDRLQTCWQTLLRYCGNIAQVW